MSFAMTIDQMVAGTKDVTRRIGWAFAMPGMIVQPVRKCMGLKAGESIEVICPPIEFICVRRETLSRMLDEPEYGAAEVIREGFPNLTPAAFVEMFCRTHRGCTLETLITRTEFRPAAAPGSAVGTMSATTMRTAPAARRQRGFKGVLKGVRP